MRTILRSTLAALGTLALAVPAAAQFGGPPPPPNTGVPIFASLSSGVGEGNITVVIDPPKGTACYIMNVQGLENVTGANIHLGGPGETGRSVMALEAPEGGTSGGCTDIAPQLSEALLANPQGYYVTVQTRAFPDGAIRGQLRS